MPKSLASSVQHNNFKAYVQFVYKDYLMSGNMRRKGDYYGE